MTEQTIKQQVDGQGAGGIYDYPPFGPGKIDRILMMDQTQRGEFDKHYYSLNDIIVKYRLARDLVTGGKFENPISLLNNFTPPHLHIPREYQDVVEPLRERLSFLLVQKGHLAPSSIGQESSERIIKEELQRRENLQDFINEGWPIEVVGQLMTVDLFSDITDAKKLEEYRAWTTRGILREYLGVLSGKTSKKDLTISDIMDRIPERIFSDPDGIKFNLVEHYIEERLMRSVTDTGLDEGLAAIESLTESISNPQKKEFLQSITDRFYEIATLPLGKKFNDTITVKGQERPFPSFEQRTFVHDFIKHDTRLLAAETGLGKTATAYLAIENSDATRVLVIAPAGGRATWEIEEKKLFRETGNIFTIEKTDDIEAAKKSGKKYIVVSHELLGLAEHNPQIAAKLDQLIDETKIDGAIIDEITDLNKKSAISTRTTEHLIDNIRQNFALKTGKPSEIAPVVGLSAMPIRSKLSDMNVTMGLLYPDKYVTSHGESTPSKKTFSDSHLNRPDLVYFTLIGEKRMFRWEQASSVQNFTYENVIFDVSPFEEFLYTYIANELPIDQLSKMRILEDCLLNPLLIKAEVRALANGNTPSFDVDQVMDRLSSVVREWKKRKSIDTPVKDSDHLNVDRLVELGMGNMVLGCFLSDSLENGIDTLVEACTRGSNEPDLIDLRKFWKDRSISSKYDVLKKLVQDSLKWKTGPDGTLSRQKVFIVSPARKQGRTGDVLQRKFKRENGDKSDLYEPYELDTINDTILATLVQEWTDNQDVLLVDGSVSVGKKRDKVISRWVNDPNAAILIVTLEAAYKSRDYTLNVVDDARGRKIDGIRKIFLAPPWNYEQLKQMGGRSQRQGQLIPVDVKILEGRDLIDHGKGEAVLFTYLLSRMALSGIVLTPSEQAFFDSKRIGGKMSLQSAEAGFMRNALSFVRGAGEELTSKFLKEKSATKGEITHEQLIAEKFFDEGRDEYHISGYNAELVAYLIKNLVDSKSNILSLGAGTLLLQRKLKKGIDNVDLNPQMMEAGWEKAKQYGGRKIDAKASSLSEDDFPSDSYDVVDSAFTLNWSSLAPKNGRIQSSERVKILSQIHRVLKPGGHFILTLPESSLDESRFDTLTNALEEHFGFKVDEDLSGRSYGRSKFKLTKRLGWCIVAKKEKEVDVENLDIDLLEFAGEDGKWISTGLKKTKGQKNIQGKEYPTPDIQLEFDQYEIISSNNQIHIVTYNDEEEKLPSEQFEDETERTEPGKTKIDVHKRRFLKGISRADFREYKNMVHRVKAETGLRFRDAEAMCIE
ncbi:MAG TPA: methyltransferase domain-containing protein, partial [Xanthomonadales bacterium]|nr:methyltransferase domain-containing protein [Xanthomonadales bacterium]